MTLKVMFVTILFNILCNSVYYYVCLMYDVLIYQPKALVKYRKKIKVVVLWQNSVNEDQIDLYIL